MLSFRPAAILSCLALFAAGCGNRPASRVDMAAISPGAAGSQAMELFDANKDGSIAGAEFDKAPGLKASLKPKLDSNNDGKASADEISARLQTYLDSKVAALSCRCEVHLDDQPLEGATVRLVPEGFLGSAVKPGVATSDKLGVAMAQTEDSKLPGLSPGIYRVEISKKDASGKEIIPARYNAQTTLGCEVASDLDSVSVGTVFKLKSSP